MQNLGGNIIPLYDSAPAGQIQVEELEELLTMRHDLLHSLETRYQKLENDNKISAPIVNFLQSYETKIGWGAQNTIDNDKTSHFILSLAFCKTDQERFWFASWESKLFMARLIMHKVDLEQVLAMLNIPLERQDNLSESLLDKIRFRDRGQNMTHNSQVTYRIPFEYALNLISTMQYFLHKGYVYISKAEIYQLIETVFKENLVKKVLNIYKNLDRALADNRIKYLIANFQTKREVETLSKPFSNVKVDNISFKEVDALAEKAFPLCMQLLNRSLTTDGHLKHWGRLQYGLFLKGIGLSLEDSLNFWKNKFSKTVASDKFDKEYAYNIRHSYGKEGKRNDYIPWSCYKIQNLPTPSTAEHHGCPFKVFSEDKMRHLLYELKFKELDVLKILEKVRGKEPSVRI